MKMINLTTPSSKVKMVVTIDGTDHWGYRCIGDRRIKNSVRDNLEKVHELGLVKNLIGDSNYLEFHLGNIHDQAINVLVKIEWFENNKSVGVWYPRQADDETKKVKIPSSSGIEIIDSVYFY